VEDAGNLAWIVALSVGVGGTWSAVLLFATGNLRGEGEIDGLLPVLAVLIPVDVFLFSLAALRWRSLQT
jgi:hypothetical protein